MYYSICSGIVKPISPEESKVLKQKEDKKFDLDREINRNTSNLYDRALFLDSTDCEKLSEYSDNVDDKKDTEEFFTPMDCVDQSESYELKMPADSPKLEFDDEENNFSDAQEDANHCEPESVEQEAIPDDSKRIPPIHFNNESGELDIPQDAQFVDEIQNSESAV